MLVIFMSFTSISQMHSLNLAMMYYEQLEVMPINMTCIMISWMVSGMFLLREGQYYSTTDLVWIFSSFAICCLGIKVLMSKIKQQRDIKWRQRAGSFEATEADDGYFREVSEQKK